MNKKTVNISLPKIEGVKLKNATVDLEKGVVVAEYGQEDEQEDAEKDISEIATGFASAVNYLDEDIHNPDFFTTKKTMSKLEAFSNLLILSKAWNKFDEFEPDWEDLEQMKHHPIFKLVNGKLEFSHVVLCWGALNTHISNFSFKTEERAEQFGKQFIELFRIVLSN